MVAAADSLVWEIVKNNNSFMRKKNGRTARSGSIRFSTERGNLMSRSTYKYSGLANSKTIDISIKKKKKKKPNIIWYPQKNRVMPYGGGGSESYGHVCNS